MKHVALNSVDGFTIPNNSALNKPNDITSGLFELSESPTILTNLEGGVDKTEKYSYFVCKLIVSVFILRYL